MLNLKEPKRIGKLSFKRILSNYEISAASIENSLVIEKLTFIEIKEFTGR